jgi:uncharacterized protein YneR
MNGYFIHYLIAMSFLFFSCNNEKHNTKPKSERDYIIDEIDSLFNILGYELDSGIYSLSDSELFYLKKSLFVKIEGTSSSSLEIIYNSEDDLLLDKKMTYYKLLVIDAFKPQGDFFQLFKRDSNFVLIHKRFDDTVIVDKTEYEVHTSKIDSLNFYIEKEMFWNLPANDTSANDNHHCESWIFEARIGSKYSKTETCFGKYNFMLYLKSLHN